MEIGDTVFQNYGGIQRYGKVKDIKNNLNGGGWAWYKIDWIDDEKFEVAMKWKAKMRNKEANTYIPEYYRCDDVEKISLVNTLNTLEKLIH